MIEAHLKQLRQHSSLKRNTQLKENLKVFDITFSYQNSCVM
jgi:hypothetical protein